MPPPPQANAAQAPQQTYIIQSPQRRTPAWVITILVALLFGAVLAGVYLFVIPRVTGGGGADQAAVDRPPIPNELLETQATPLKPHPYARYLELTGFRVSEDDNQQTEVKFLVVNHSTTAFDGVELKVDLTTDRAKPDDPPISTFTANVSSIPAGGSQEVSEKIQTKLRAYELPDWQFIRARFEILKPQM